VTTHQQDDAEEDVDQDEDRAARVQVLTQLAGEPAERRTRWKQKPASEVISTCAIAPGPSTKMLVPWARPTGSEFPAGDEPATAG